MATGEQCEYTPCWSEVRAHANLYLLKNLLSWYCTVDNCGKHYGSKAHWRRHIKEKHPDETRREKDEDTNLRMIVNTAMRGHKEYLQDRRTENSSEGKQPQAASVAPASTSTATPLPETATPSAPAPRTTRGGNDASSLSQAPLPRPSPRGALIYGQSPIQRYNTLFNGAPSGGPLESTSPYQTAPQFTAPQFTAPHITAPRNIIARDMTPRNVAAPHTIGSYATAPRNTAPRNTAIHNTALHNTAPHPATPHTTAPHNSRHYSTTPYSATPYTAPPYSARPSGAMPSNPSHDIPGPNMASAYGQFMGGPSFIMPWQLHSSHNYGQQHAGHRPQTMPQAQTRNGGANGHIPTDIFHSNYAQQPGLDGSVSLDQIAFGWDSFPLNVQANARNGTGNDFLNNNSNNDNDNNDNNDNDNNNNNNNSNNSNDHLSGSNPLDGANGRLHDWAWEAGGGRQN